MLAITAPEPIAASPQSLADMRTRTAGGERSLLPDAPAGVSASGDAGHRFPERRPPPEPAPPPQPQLTSGAMFAAAVIAGALTPRPQSIEEVYARIGNAWIPPESELKLRDLAV